MWLMKLDVRLFWQKKDNVVDKAWFGKINKIQLIKLGLANKDNVVDKAGCLWGFLSGNLKSESR